MQYNKLIRDNIPEIIKKNGQKAEICVLSDDDYKTSLQEKLLEEVNEYFQDNNISEIADILEVIEALCVLHGFSAEDVLNIKNEKAKINGKFEKKLFLVSVEDKNEQN